jgi:hypothetical protein
MRIATQSGTGLLFQQEAKTSGRIAEELIVLMVKETTKLDFSKHLTATSGRRPDLLAHLLQVVIVGRMLSWQR